MNDTSDIARGHAWRRLSILGGGRVTTEFWLPALRRMNLLDLTTVAEPADDRCAEIAAAFPGVSTVALPYDAFLNRLEPPARQGRQAVVIAVPNALHVDASRRAIARGHHVLCEKPLALKRAPCDELAEAARDAGVLAKVAMTRRYLPTFLLARDILRSGELGALQSIVVRDIGPFSWNPRSFDFFAPDSGGILADMGVHYLDYLETLAGPMTPTAYEDDARGGTESRCVYRLAAGLVDVELHLSRVGHSGRDIVIHCERGVITIHKENEAELTVEKMSGSQRRVSLVKPFDDAAWPTSYEGSFSQIIAELGRAIDGMPAQIADASDAARTAELIEWAYAHRATKVTPAQLSGGGRKVLVTGGTGFIGGHLVDRLTEGGDAIRVTVRVPRSCANAARFPVDMAPTDLTDMQSVRRAVDGCSIVYHLAYGNEGGSGATAITIEGTKNVVRAAVEAGVECVIVLSTMYVFGFPDGKSPVDETFAYKPYGGEYAISKAEMERWCLDEASRSGRTRIVVLNPTCVFGPLGGAYTSLPVDLALTGQFCWIDGGRGTANYTYVSNTVDAILAAAQCEAAHGERFIVTDGHTTWRDLLAPFLAPLDREIPSYSAQELAALPRFGGPFRVRDVIGAAIGAPEVRSVVKRSPILRRAFSMSKELALARSVTSPTSAPPSAEAVSYPPEWLADLFPTASTTFSAAKAARVLGWTPRIDLAHAQAETIRWLVETGRLPGKRVAAGAMPPAMAPVAY